ncbi:hypothetical protein M407DRAFT_240795 [Tulasnella calospora MUT 4182]|uniref:Uncharacterized protein n=1 Tax=Tulasnella calospora MUT 4182 TaxID=1051891 RepID=A0A0C3QWK0_9AGAM|nr:hypothetical protein M407DRAFT_240795 [Tulasnella calospora MUT 4182]
MWQGKCEDGWNRRVVGGKDAAREGSVGKIGRPSGSGLSRLSNGRNQGMGGGGSSGWV